MHLLLNLLVIHLDSLSLLPNQIYSLSSALTRLRSTIPASLQRKLKAAVERGVYVPVDPSSPIGFQIPNTSLKRLISDDWLDDEVLNTYLARLAQHYDKQTIPSVIFTPNSSSVQKKQKLYTDVIIAINPGKSHWLLLHLICNEGTQRIDIHDSIGQTLETYRKMPEVRKVIKYMHYYGHNENEWTLRIIDSEKQIDGISCGVFTMYNAKSVCTGERVPALNHDIFGYRYRLLLEILSGQILPMVM
jgi:Ulp1 family protease